MKLTETLEAIWPIMIPHIATSAAIVAGIWLIVFLWRLGKAADEANHLIAKAVNDLGEKLREKKNQR